MKNNKVFNAIEEIKKRNYITGAWLEFLGDRWEEEINKNDKFVMVDIGRDWMWDYNRRDIQTFTEISDSILNIESEYEEMMEYDLEEYKEENVILLYDLVGEVSKVMILTINELGKMNYFYYKEIIELLNNLQKVLLEDIETIKEIERRDVV